MMKIGRKWFFSAWLSVAAGQLVAYILVFRAFSVMVAGPNFNGPTNVVAYDALGLVLWGVFYLLETSRMTWVGRWTHLVAASDAVLSISLALYAVLAVLHG